MTTTKRAWQKLKLLLIRNVKLVGRLFAILLGIIHTWAAIRAYSMNADGINYLDMGDAFWTGDWGQAVNPVWSPLYGWLLGLVMHLLGPSLIWEFAVVQLTNLAIYICALFAFERFWDHLRQCRPSMAWPKWAWWGLGYSLFVWAMLNVMKLWAVTPDLLMATLLLAVATLFLQLRQGKESWPRFLLSGLFLGLAYLTKAIMLPVGLLLLGLLLVTVRRRQLLLLTLGVFLLTSVPYIVAVSKQRGRLSWGDAGTLTFARYVNGLEYPHWQGGPPANGTPVHPSRLILDAPPVYEFDGPVGGTYPISFDPMYWYEGVRVDYDLHQQLRVLLQSGIYLSNLVLGQLGVLLALALMLSRPWNWQMPAWKRLFRGLPGLIRSWGLLFLSCAAMGAYSLVLVEGRYVAVFVLLALGETISKVSNGHRMTVNAAGTLSIAVLLLQIIVFNVTGALDLEANHSTEAETTRDPRWPGETADALRDLGVPAGAKVGVIGYAFDSFWARLARVQIVAELLGQDALPFWIGDQSQRQRVIDAFAAAGVYAIIAERVPSYAHLEDWHQVGDSSYFIYIVGSDPRVPGS
jgi:hypothetical protein